MKTLVLVRHAETRYPLPNQADFDRELAESGRLEAWKMAFFLQKESILPEVFISSPAKRAVQTAQIFVEILTRNQSEILKKEILYEPSVQSFYKVIEEIPNEVSSAIIFSHNPGISHFVNDLDCMPPTNLITCGIFALTFDSDKWTDFQLVPKSLLFYRSPMNKL